MKHNLRVTLALIALFFAAQVIGLGLIGLDLDVSEVNGVTTVDYSDTVLGPRPEVTGMGGFLYLVLGVGVGTLLLLLIIRFKKFNLWKFWFFLASFFAMALALEVVAGGAIALIVGLVLALLKIYRPNIYVHNFTEVLIYSGLAVFLVPMLDLYWAFMLLIAFSVYDAYAVWKSKHMVAMAEFQKDSELFAGLNVPYHSGKKPKKGQPSVKEKVKTAVLGGGDIAFPLLFSGVVLEWLVLGGMSKAGALLQALIITLTATVSLALLFYYAEKDKFYPAMPFLTAGCFAGFLIVFLI